MSRYFLKSIKIEGFRGINNEDAPLELSFHKNSVNSIHAINGNGKSSIYEALCYVIRGTVPKLDKLLQHERPSDYVCNIFHSRNTATIEVEFESDSNPDDKEIIIVTRHPDGTRSIFSPSGCYEPEKFLKNLDDDFTLLDYTTFSRFIDSTPLDRGRSFSALLGLSKYSDLRQVLQYVTDTRVLNNDFELSTREDRIRTLESNIQNPIERLNKYYEKIVATKIADIGLLDKCEIEILRTMEEIELIKPHFSGKNQLDVIDFEDILKTIKSAEGGEKRQEFQNILKKIGELDSLKDSRTNSFDSEQEAIIKAIKDKSKLLNKTKGDNYRKLYETVSSLIINGELENENICPLCESTIDTAISQIVTTQLEQYVQVSRMSEEIIKLWNTSEWVKQLIKLEEARVLDLKQEARISGTCSIKANRHSITTEDIHQAIELFKLLREKRNEISGQLDKRKKELEQELPKSLVTLSEQIESCRQFSYALQEYRGITEQLKGFKSQLKIRERWRDFIIGAADAYSIAEASLSRKKISDIHDSFQELFKDVVHVPDIVPQLERTTQSEALNINLSNFHGKSGVSARAILSESYRNALAISVFFSAALNHNGISRFMVLDDITSSFDSGHQWNLMEILRTKMQYSDHIDGLQIILLSHDGLLEKYFDKLGNTVDWNHQKLKGWPPTGTVMSHNQDAGRLKVNAIRFLDAGQIDQAEPLIRQYLEFKLLQIINKVSICVPLDFSIKDHLKMVSNSLNAIQNQIKIYKDAGKLILEPNQIRDLETIHVPLLVGNWVSHYETRALSSISPVMLKSILDSIDNFGECFRYDDTTSGTIQRKWYRSLSSK